ncbi:uncharacterized protein LOC126747849 [Anthonomus grandis grandis]|uniref:uncharacterized protein LOC126747849 n=1 Tax=Anthonomus grandis grandis TaxID=2921223 RepID=UPI00216586FE|nr:uncharacterized protein LOC126747849 [Anthonomus grandis grandis]
MNPSAMRRSSVARLQSQNSEPQIVIEGHETEDSQKSHSSRQSSEEESPMNPYLLTPFGREVRKHSLPTPQCSGITASQIRRLSDRGDALPGPRQAEFLATLSQGPQVSPGGRRHSVVTISKVPPAFFGGKNRRESVAAYPNAFSSRILPNRRESIACPPSSESRGSIHNLQLDIMDDIVQARKVRMKVWNTSNEKLCEVQPIDEGPSGNAQRYSISNTGRRFSDFVGTTLPPIPSSSKRRASELPPPLQSTSKQKSGIVCTNTDLISILSSLSTSATEINQWEKEEVPSPCHSKQQQQQRMSANRINQKLKNSRSNSFDVSTLQPSEIPSKILEATTASRPYQAASNWFVKRHEPKSRFPLVEPPVAAGKKVVRKEPGKVLWDKNRGSIVNVQALGSAIEGFLTQSAPESPSNKEKSVPSKGTKLSDKVLGAANKVLGVANKANNWFNKTEEEPVADACDSSLCSTLKDLFVK